MRILELFKGTGSVSKWVKENNYNIDVYSLDILKKFNPTWCGDIMEWNYKEFDKDYFDIIWASPECKIFSKLQFTQVGRKWKNKDELYAEQKHHTKFILRTLEIIEYFKPKYWYIENPATSTIWNYIPEKYNNFITIDYCRFGYNYKKGTKILTNVKLDDSVCKIRPHTMWLGWSTGRKQKDTTNVLQRYSIPPKLITYLFQFIAVPTSNEYFTKCNAS